MDPSQNLFPGEGKIFLIGFMGSGKTYWGTRWANAYQLPFVDLDDAIEDAAGKKIAVIFETSGEAYFRELEAKVLRSFSLDKKIIIACGGGTPCYHQNMQWMKEHGITIYLKATPQQLAERSAREKQKRPLIKDISSHEIEAFIEGKLKQREPFYNKAKLILDTDEISDGTLAEKISDFR